MSILVVDDRPENLVALEVSLESLGQRIVRATSGEGALRAVLDEQFAVILMDIRMPGLDGFETLELLRLRDKSRHIPIIFLTAHSESHNLLRTWSSGAVDCLEKPVDPAALRAKVSVFVHLRQNELALHAAHNELEARVQERTHDLAMEIERRKLVEQRLLEQAHRDALTGLANRKLLIEHLNHAVARWGRKRTSKFAVMMIDLDRFKVVNDSLGHLAGDQLLVEVAQRLQHCLRGVDTAARIGGDEFAILLDEISELRDATRTSDRIHRALSEPFVLDGREIHISCSLGLAMIDDRYGRGEELLRDADTALYRAKEAGRSRTQVFDQEMHIAVLDQLRGEQELGAAIERDELRLYYQPIVALASGEIVGFEALLRWQHPTHGFVEPSRFIPLAEETGLIRPLGRWAVEQACEQLSRWNQLVRLPLGMGVNVSANQLAEPGFAAHVARSLHDRSLDPKQLEIELTERTMMTSAAAETHGLAGLVELGVSLSLDDFGTGYSCLSSLKDKTLKIDRSLISSIDSATGAEAGSAIGTAGEHPDIVQAIVGLAHALELVVVAKGVETEAQLARLRELECGHAQGYVFARALPADQATELLRTRPW